MHVLSWASVAVHRRRTPNSNATEAQLNGEAR